MKLIAKSVSGCITPNIDVCHNCALLFLVEECGHFFCLLFCPYGFKVNDKGCKVCECKKGVFITGLLNSVIIYVFLVIVNCTYYSPLSLVNKCHNRCIRSDRICYWCDHSCNNSSKYFNNNNDIAKIKVKMIANI